MRTIFCAGRWMCLLVLAGAMILPETRGNKKTVPIYLNNFPSNDLQVFSVGETCCLEANGMVKETIVKCVKQTPKKGCNSSNYAVQVESGDWFCIRADSKWMKKQIELGEVKCE